MAMIQHSSAKPPTGISSVGVLVGQGWKVISDGPAGTQLEGPKVMTPMCKGAMLVGAVLVFAYGIGLIVIFAALIDHAMAKPPTRFFPR